MTKGRPRSFDSSQTLERVMDSFWRHGYDGTTFEHLVGDTQLSRSSLYNAFGGKDALFSKAIDLYIERQQAGFLSSLNDPVSGGQFLLEVLSTFGRPHDRRSRGCLLQNTILLNASTASKPREVSKIGDCLSRMWDSFRAALKLTPRRKVGVTDDEKAALLVAVLFGVAVIARNGRNRELVSQIASGATKLAESDQ